jgi:hypothetical protein
VGVIAGAACNAGGGSTKNDEDSGSGSGASSGNPGAGGMILNGPGSGGGSSVGGGCASESIQADGLPLDMAVMFDRSGSMEEGVSGGSKWQVVTGALNDFMALPESTGIGMGIQFFPIGGAMCPVQCFSTADCGADCGTCFGAFMGFPGICTNAGEDNCTLADYEAPMVPIALLPGVQPDISAALAGNAPSDGGTPTGVALTGAINYARTHAAANSNHVVIVVLVTDGNPTSCNPSDIPSIQNIAAQGVAGSPSILTFVIGVGDSLTNLHAIAEAGGSTQAFIVDTAADVEQQFLDALEEIKGSVLGCTFTIPQPEMGDPDYNKVNVAYTPGGGMEETIPRVDGPGECPAMGDGWYYNDPANPTQIILCPYTCERVSGDDMGKVDIVLGCATVIE